MLACGFTIPALISNVTKRCQAEQELARKVAAEQALQRQLLAAVDEREALVRVMEQKAKEADAEASARQKVTSTRLYLCDTQHMQE